MPKLVKLLGTVAITACFAGGAFAEEAKKPLTVDTVVATVNGKDITLGQMIVVRSNLPGEYLQLPDDVLFDGILDQLVQQTALSELGEGTLGKRDQVGLEVERRSYLAGAVLDKTAAAASSDDAVKAAYDAQYADHEPGFEYHAAHIIVPTEDEAKAVKADLDGGKDFAEEAKEKSTDGAAANGGDLGWFTPDRMVPEFADVVEKMKVGDITGPVQTQYGWHVIKLFESRPAKAPTLDEARDQIAGELRQKAVQDRVLSAVQDAKVEKMVDGIDRALLKDDKLFDQ